MHFNLVGANNDRLNIRSRVSVRHIDILQSFGVLHRDQLSSMWQLLIQKVPECISHVAPNLSVSPIYRTSFRPKKCVLYGEIAITA